MFLFNGNCSPDNMASFTWLLPLIITPSPGIVSPGFISTKSFFTNSLAATNSSFILSPLPLGNSLLVIFVAVIGINFNKFADTCAA